jgi:hypothetical protein
MNKRGFDVVEKRSITYTRKSPAAKLTGLGEVDFEQQYYKAPKYVRDLIDDLGEEPGYEKLRRAAIALQKRGWYLDFGLDGGITELRRLRKNEKKPYKIQGTKTAAKKPTAKQLAARAKFTKMVKARAAAKKGKKVAGVTYKQSPEKVVSGINDRNWWAGLGKIPKSGKVNWLMVPTERVAKKIQENTAAGFVPRIKVAIARGKNFESLPKVTSSESAARAIKAFFTGSQLQTQEYGGAMFLDKQNRILGVYVGFIGGIDAALFDTRLVFGAAVNVGATGLILFHNHPSGSLAASPADESMTTRFQKAGQVMDIQIIDHIILTKNNYYSFRDERKIM